MPATPGEDQRATPLDFQELESLRLYAKQILQNQETSLKYFEYGVGYQHFRGKNKISVSSSATCVISLVATDKWKASKEDTKDLLEYLTSRRKSAGLKDDNAFTVAWILESVAALERKSASLGRTAKNRVARLERVLQDALSSGGVSIEPYPPSAYLTQLVVRVLRARSKLNVRLRRAVDEWAWAELARQLALVQAKSKTADAFAVAYLLMLVAAVTPTAKTDPEQTSIQRSALQTFFECQLDDGTWPLSRPLFHYPNFGNAYCYEYEMLTQLLQETELQPLLLDYLPRLSSAAKSVSSSVYRVEKGVQAWTSGHHPNQAEPESWATASVYHFVHMLDRLLAEAVRRQLFRYTESPRPIAGTRKLKKSDFAGGFLDSLVKVHGKQRSLKEFLWEGFVKPLWEESEGIAKGRTFGKKTPRSAIFFGPPGTSKTELSKEIALFLGWPHLAIDPSLLLRKGMDGIQAEANAIFHMLEQTERVVVLFDEFDELVLERGSPKAEAFSRFLTTSMLPKLASIHNRATLVFIIATNNIGDFDLAIRRQGRFDRVVQIMPPTYKAKMMKKDWGVAKIDLGARLQSLGVKVTPEIKQQLGDLTYGESDAFATELARVTNQQEGIRLLGDHWRRCTLQTHVSKAHITQEEETTWAERCRAEAIHNV